MDWYKLGQQLGSNIFVKVIFFGLIAILFLFLIRAVLKR